MHSHRVQDIRAGFAESLDSSVYGPGTLAPIGFTLPELDRIFYYVKKFKVSGSVPGVNEATTQLYDGNASSGRAYPEDDLRHHLFIHLWNHVTPEVESGARDTYVVQISPFGYKAVPLYYPFFDCFCEPESEDVNPSATVSMRNAGGIESGTLHILGRSAPLYENNGGGIRPPRPDHPGEQIPWGHANGDVQMEIDAKWEF